MNQNESIASMNSYRKLIRSAVARTNTYPTTYERPKFWTTDWAKPKLIHFLGAPFESATQK